jgi:uracil-DNA glycosylase
MHGAEVDLPEAGLRLFGVYHPSQQNTQTGLLTPAMYAKVLKRVRRFLEEPKKESPQRAQRSQSREG